MPLPRLLLPPEAEGFTCRPLARAYALQLDSPDVEYRSFEPVQAWEVTGTWKLDPLEFGYFMAFWRTTCHKGATRFETDLPIEQGLLIPTTCSFMKPPRVNQVDGPLVSLGVVLEAMPSRRADYYRSANDAALVEELQV